jgi:hypothetical protein
MIRGAVPGLALAGCAAALALTAAQRPPALAGIQPGLWELAGMPGAKAPARECISDVQLLTRLEHRTMSCTSKVISDDGRSTVVEYSCGAAGFGHSKLEVITPRSLKISTQGISDALPFNYTLQAHRVGECSAQASATRH